MHPLHFAEASDDAVLNDYAGGSASYGAIGAQVFLHSKTIEGNVQRTPPLEFRGAVAITD